ncbi:MAG: LPS-assembly protein LptD [Alphaproteobacteria bacterium]|nr:LPS-assembly protein LptD [Alphaproteobacteria bacterium]
MKKLNFICLTALPLLILAAPAAAQQVEPKPQQQAPPPAAAGPADAPRQVDFSASQLSYDSDNEIVTAVGEVRMLSQGNHLRADSVAWNRKTDEVRAIGNVRVVNPQGDTVYGDDVLLTNDLKDGVIDNMLLVLADGGRLAATKAVRKDGYTTLEQATYSPCPVLDDDGCPKTPTWQITAVKVLHDPVKHRISYQHATFDFLGMPILALPWFSHPDGSEGGSSSGFLVPVVRLSSRNGFEVATPYYVRLAPNRDATITPHIYTGVLPAIEGSYRQLTGRGAFQLGGFLTYGSSLDPTNSAADPKKNLRFYLEGNGRLQLDPLWSITASGRYTTDRTFLRRYDISRDTRLRSVVEAERIDENSYISIAGWAFEGLRTTDVSGQQPFALPAIDARWRIDDPVWNGKIELQANSVAILRREGQDTQRAFVSARWDRRSLTPWGQELLLTGFARADIYHTGQTDLTPTVAYRGQPGWETRAIAALAAELRWPLIGPAFGGTQHLTPRLQIVASPPTKNLSIPNEDARSVDLEDSNLFALNRFPGYDRWEDGPRVTYGFDYGLDLPGVSISTNLGQSYRLNQKPSILPQGTGLADRFSDVVGRTTVKFGHLVSFTGRYRIDKDNFAIRRAEIDAVVGGHQTYATIGYLRLNRNIDPAIEDLRDREEIRLGGRIRFARYWSIFGSTVIDLTDAKEDPLSVADGFEPIRHRVGVSYEDNCIEIGLTWRRDYDTAGDFRRGNTFALRVAFKNLGR